MTAGVPAVPPAQVAGLGRRRNASVSATARGTDRGLWIMSAACTSMRSGRTRVDGEPAHCPGRDEEDSQTPSFITCFRRQKAIRELPGSGDNSESLAVLVFSRKGTPPIRGAVIGSTRRSTTRATERRSTASDQGSLGPAPGDSDTENDNANVEHCGVVPIGGWPTRLAWEGGR